MYIYMLSVSGDELIAAEREKTQIISMEGLKAILYLTFP